MQTIRLYDRHGSFVGYCDLKVPEPPYDLPNLPEVLSLKQATARVFLRLGQSTDYREVRFDWADNFRLQR
jgi:hypothetical protein